MTVHGQFDAQDGLDARLQGFLLEPDNTGEVIVVGDGQCRLAVESGLLDESINGAPPVEK